VLHSFRSSWLAYSALLLFVFSGAAASRAAIPLQNATATFSQTSFGGSPVAQAIDGNLGSTNGWAIYEGPTDCCGALPGHTNSQIAVFETASDISFAGGAHLTFTLQHLFFTGAHTIGRFRLSATTDSRSTFADGLSSGGDVSAAWTVLAPSSASASNGTTLSVLGDNSILAGGANPQTSIYTVTAFTSLVGITGVRLEVLADGSFPDLGPGRNSNGNFALTEFQLDASSLLGDHNRDGTVDAADYVVWKKTDGQPPGYNLWRTHFGEPNDNGSGGGENTTVPEPATIVMLVLVSEFRLSSACRLSYAVHIG
jgi:hypothetical protein